MVDFSIFRAKRECQVSFKIKRLGNYFLIFLFIFQRLGKNIEYRYNTNRYSYAYQRYGNSKVDEHIIISLSLYLNLNSKIKDFIQRCCSQVLSVDLTY